MHAYKKDQYSNPSHDNRETILADPFPPPAQNPTGTLTVVKYKEATLESHAARPVRQFWDRTSVLVHNRILPLFLGLVT